MGETNNAWPASAWGPRLPSGCRWGLRGNSTNGVPRRARPAARTYTRFGPRTRFRATSFGARATTGGPVAVAAAARDRCDCQRSREPSSHRSLRVSWTRAQLASFLTGSSFPSNEGRARGILGESGGSSGLVESAEPDGVGRARSFALEPWGQRPPGPMWDRSSR